MPVSPLVRLITLPTSGTVTIDVADNNTLYVVTGNVTLVGDLTIESSGTPFSALQVFIIYKAVVTVGAFNLTIFDEVFSDVQATVKQNITATYHSGAWDVDTAPDASENGWIETHMYGDETVTNAKLADMVRGTVKVGDATNRPSDLPAETNGYVLIGDGTDIISQPLGIAVANIFASLVVKATTSAALPAFTYNNGAGGVGATITINANGVAPAINGVTSTFGMRFLNKDSADQRYNGIYQWTNFGSAGTQAVATRTTDSDQTAELDTQIVTATDGTDIDGAGNNNANKPYTQQTDSPLIGTDIIVYIKGLGKVNNWKLLGNTLTTESWIGTKSNHDFPIRTNNTEKARVFATGELAIGIAASPLGTLHVKGLGGQSPLYVANNGGTGSLEYTNADTIKRGGALFSVAYSSLHTSWGSGALANVNTVISGNSAFGANALAANTTGYENNGFGYGALLSNQTGLFNNAFGKNALASLNGGSYNTAMGNNAGSALATTANYHTFLGGTAGYTQTGGTGTTYLGFETFASSGTFSFSVALGYKAQISASNQLAIGSVSDSAHINQWQNVYSATGTHSTHFLTATPEGSVSGTFGDWAFVNTGAIGQAYIKQTNPTATTGWVLLSTGGSE